MLKALFLREWRLTWRHAGDIGVTLGFLLIACSLFPLAVGPEPKRLAMMAGGVIWVLCLLAVIISLDRLFQKDHDDGILAQLYLSQTPAFLLVMVKAFVHWLSIALPIIAITPLAGLFLNLPTPAFFPLLLGLLLATPSLSLIGTMGAALTLGTRRSAILLTILILPFYIPILIFAVIGFETYLSGLNAMPHFLILAVLFIMSILICPFIGGQAIKLHQH